MVHQNVWDEGKWATIKKVSFDFMTQYIFEHMANRFSFRNKRILELGCGTGRLSYLALKEGAASVTLVDSSQKAVALARGIFEQEAPGSYGICHSDIFEFSPAQRYDLVFSSGLIEHFKGEDRYRIVKKHLDLSHSDSIIIHPTDTLYSRIFNKLPIAVKLYGFQQSYSDQEMSSCLQRIPEVRQCENERFHTFYTVPLLHNLEPLNRGLDQWSPKLGGLTLTRVCKTGGVGSHDRQHGQAATPDQKNTPPECR